MEPNPHLPAILSRLPHARRANLIPEAWKAPCPFHPGLEETLYLDIRQDRVLCLKCHFSESLARFRETLESGNARARAASAPVLCPNDSFPPEYVEEVNGEIYKVLFLKKVQQLVSAVEKLEKLISRMGI